MYIFHTEYQRNLPDIYTESLCYRTEYMLNCLSKDLIGIKLNLKLKPLELVNNQTLNQLKCQFKNCTVFAVIAIVIERANAFMAIFYD